MTVCVEDIEVLTVENTAFSPIASQDRRPVRGWYPPDGADVLRHRISSYAIATDFDGSLGGTLILPRTLAAHHLPGRPQNSAAGPRTSAPIASPHVGR